MRQLCWVLTIEGLDTYILQPRDPADFDLLVEALRPTPRPTDVDVVVGIRGPIAPPELCNGLMVPIVVFDQIYSFDVDALIKSIPRPEKVTAKDFEPSAEELFHRIMQMADNAGATDEHRALQLSRRPLPGHLRHGGGRFGRNCLADRDRGAAVASERRAQDRRGRSSPSPTARPMSPRSSSSRRRHRGVSVPGHQVVAVLRPVLGKEERSMKMTNMPGFTAEDALYVSKTQYRLIASRGLSSKSGIQPQQLSPWWPPKPKGRFPAATVYRRSIVLAALRGRGRGLGSFLSEAMAQEGGQGHEYETAHLARL